jgi:hypothetical protein
MLNIKHPTPIGKQEKKAGMESDEFVMKCGKTGNDVYLTNRIGKSRQKGRKFLDLACMCINVSIAGGSRRVAGADALPFPSRTGTDLAITR